MASAIQKLQKWHQTKAGLLTFGLLELAFAYVFVSWAIDTGSLLDYFCAIVLIVGGLQNLGKLARKMIQHG